MPEASRRQRLSWTSSPGRFLLVGAGASLSGGFILLPVVVVFVNAFKDGWAAYWGHLADSSTMHAIGLSLLAGLVAVPLNTIFGMSAAWVVAKFRFRGRNLLISLIELPLSISPIIFGVAFLFVFGMQGLFGPWLAERGILLVFNVAAILVVTSMVTSPFVFKQVLPLMEAQGTSEEEASVTLGAGGWRTFWKVTLPNVKWGVIYGVCLCFARSLGEFGSVGIVSGAVRGKTNTITLQIDLLFNDRNQTGAFAIASILTSFAVVTLIAKTWAERQSDRKRELLED